MINLFDASEVNVRSLRYLIASTRGHCGRCGEETRLVALCLPPGHEVFELDEDAPDPAFGGQVAEHISARAMEEIRDGAQNFALGAFPRAGSAKQQDGAIFHTVFYRCGRT